MHVFAHAKTGHSTRTGSEISIYIVLRARAQYNQIRSCGHWARSRDNNNLRENGGPGMLMFLKGDDRANRQTVLLGRYWCCVCVIRTNTHCMRTQMRKEQFADFQ